MKTKTHTFESGGFSLLELLVVLAVLAVLLGIGGVYLSSFIAQARLNESAEDLGATLRRVSDVAITKSEEITLSVNETTLTWQDGAGAVLGSRTLPNEATAAPTDTVVFSGRGLPVTQHTFTVSQANGSKTVYLLPTGAVILR